MKRPPRTTLSLFDFALAAESLGFKFLESSCFSTTYVRGNDLLSIEEVSDPVFEDLEIATDFRLTARELRILGVPE
jgi:hypothetical protein